MSPRLRGAEFVSSSVFAAVPNNVSCPATSFLFFGGIVYYKQLHVGLNAYAYVSTHASYSGSGCGLDQATPTYDTSVPLGFKILARTLAGPGNEATLYGLLLKFHLASACPITAHMITDCWLCSFCVVLKPHGPLLHYSPGRQAEVQCQAMEDIHRLFQLPAHCSCCG